MAPSPVPVGTLLGLTAAVLVAHVVVLQNTALGPNRLGPVAGMVFTTRTLVIDTPVARPDNTPVPLAPVRRPRSLATSPAAANPTSVVPPAAVEEQRQNDQQPAPAVSEVVAAAPLPEPAASSAQQASEPVAPVAAVAPVAEVPVLPKDATLPVRAYTLPGSVRLKFNAIGQRARMDYNALGELLWLHDGKDYEARLELSILFARRVVTSSGRITADGLAPTRFADRFRSEQAAHFDRDKGRVTFSANTPEAPLVPGAQDQLSVFMQLASMLAGDPVQFQSGTSILVQTVGPRAAEPWTFVVEGDENLNLPGGQQLARKLVRTPRKDFDQKVEVWLAPALSYLPARIRITQPNGDFIDQMWRSTASP